ncbi:MAG: hypothetical protein KC583_03645 [Myxococcales bacterium]|nr:hypothetical protein [Myxococcales bacterium]
MWIVNPTIHRVIAHTAEKRARIDSADDALDGGDVLPGFLLALTDLFA